MIVQFLNTSFDEPNGCITNVRRQVADQGGKMVLGWRRVWSDHDIMVCDTHHAVWEDDQGTLWDITPEVMGDTAIQTLRRDSCEFVPDEDATLVNGYVRASRYHSSLAPLAAECLNRSDECVLRGDWDAADYWTDKANYLLRKWRVVIPYPMRQHFKKCD